ncbi:MAG: NAD(P)H-quinone oxidoreductase [Candidatus Omnitrophota bacterium]
MKAVIPIRDGGVEVLTLQDFPCPEPGDNQLLVHVHAAALNYADTMQRRGEYPLRPDQTRILGVEIAGTVESYGAAVTGFEKGQRVFGLVEGGGYAEYCVIEQQLALRIPDHFSFVDAAATAEVFITAHESLFELGNLEKGQSVLIHAGGSGVGTAAIQLAHHVGATVFCTLGSNEKIQKVHALGADCIINYNEQDVVREVMTHTQNRGVDVLLDFLGGEVLNRNLSVLKPGGRLILIGLLSGHSCTLDLVRVLLNRLQIKGIAMRNRPLEEKAQINRRFEQRCLPLLVQGKVKPVIHAVYPLKDVISAHREMEARRNVGKIILTID